MLADTERNPLALVEIGSQFMAEELAERAYQLEPIPVGQRLKGRHLRRGQPRSPLRLPARQPGPAHSRLDDVPARSDWTCPVTDRA